MSLRAAAACLLAVLAAAGAAPRIVAHLEDPAIKESSGLAASRANPGIYWTHNDSGDGPFLYAFDREGRSYGRWRVRGATHIDWEDMAIGPGPRRGRWYLYIGDIGDNAMRRNGVVVYRVEEPRVAGPKACRPECATARAAVLRLRYPDGPHDAESLLVHPTTGDLYVVTKGARRRPETRVYKASAAALSGGRATLSLVATLGIPETFFTMLAGGITGGGNSPDGRSVVLSDYFRAYEARLPAGARFDAIWNQPFTTIPLGLGFQVEGICYRADGKAIMAVSEGTAAPLLEISPPR